MAKTRLTNDDRSAIRAKVISHRFDPITAAHGETSHALAIRVRSRAYTGEQIRMLDEAPMGAFPHNSSLRTNVGGKTFIVEAKEGLRVFYEHRNMWEPILALPDADKLGTEIRAWAEAVEATKLERAHLQSVVKGTLAAFNTFDDLVRGWPEAERFVVARWQTRPSYSANVPAVAIRDLSAALDLPPEVEAQAA